MKKLDTTFTEPHIIGAIITEGGLVPNIIPHRGVLKATIRALKTEYLEHTMLPQIRELAKQTAEEHGTALEMVHYEPLCKDMINDPRMDVYFAENFNLLHGAVKRVVFTAFVRTVLNTRIENAVYMGLVTIIFTFTFVELFDSMGTMIGTATKAGILDPESGKFPGLSRAFFTDACGVSIGALLGTSTVTAFVESAAGVGAGGRTGLTAVTCGICFLLSLFFSPFMMLIPEAATSPILVIVGVFMMEQIHTIDFSDFTEGFPAFMVIVLMPFTYNIANGVSAGLILYPLLKILTGRGKELHWIMRPVFLMRIRHILY